MFLRFWVLFWMWEISVLRIKQVSWQIPRAQGQGWSRMLCVWMSNSPILAICEDMFQEFIGWYWFKGKFPNRNQPPKGIPYIISVAFQPFAGDMLHPNALKGTWGRLLWGRSFMTDCETAMWGATGFTQLIFDVKSNCRDQLNDMVKLGRQERSEQRDELVHIGRRFDKAHSLQFTREAWLSCESFCSSSLSVYARSTGWLRQELDLISNLKLLNLYATRETDYIGLRSMHASSQTVKSCHLRPIKQNPTMCQDDPTVCPLKRPSRRLVHCSSIMLHISYFYLHYVSAQVPCLCTMQ